VILPDINILIGAYRPDSPHHAVCRPWLDRVVALAFPFGITTATLASVIRITTNPRAFNDPSDPVEAFGFCSDLLSNEACMRIEPGERHWAIFEKLCLAINLTSKLVSDAWLAAIAVEHGCTFVTLDSDFARFPGLRWSFPTFSENSR